MVWKNTGFRASGECSKKQKKRSNVTWIRWNLPLGVLEPGLHVNFSFNFNVVFSSRNKLYEDLQIRKKWLWPLKFVKVINKESTRRFCQKCQLGLAISNLRAFSYQKKSVLTTKLFSDKSLRVYTSIFLEITTSSFDLEILFIRVIKFKEVDFDN